MEKILYTNFEQVGDTMSGILSSPQFAGKLKKYNLTKVWKQIVGERFSKSSYPSNLFNEVLKVACENATITSELNLSKRMILQKLKPVAKSLGMEVEDIIFTHKIWKAEEQIN